MHLLKDQDASLEPLAGKTVAVLGYGNQGQAQALNLRDSGVHVIAGNRDDGYRERAIADGFAPVGIAEAAQAGDILLVLTTDESQPLIWHDQIAPGLRAGKTLVWASGYNVGYGLIQPPLDADVVMVAPRMTGVNVRNLFVKGSGALAQFAVHQDATGRARATTLALCKGVGLTRGGVFESSFREEAELDLFAEQVVWAGLTAWFVECFEIGVEQGFAPDLMVMGLYASGETAEIFAAMTRNGFFKQMTHHSTTSQYGTLATPRRTCASDWSVCRAARCSTPKIWAAPPPFSAAMKPPASPAHRWWSTVVTSHAPSFFRRHNLRASR
jgi:ketol-acid reductoisomerase